MMFFLALSLAASGSLDTPIAYDSCRSEMKAAKVASRLNELPSEIRDHLNRVTQGGMGERDARLLQTDAPVGAEKNYSRARFAQAVLIDGKWFVQFEVAMFSGVRTFVYIPNGGGEFVASPSHYFGGPPCETLKAALGGVTTPGGFNF